MNVPLSGLLSVKGVVSRSLAGPPSAPPGVDPDLQDFLLQTNHTAAAAESSRVMKAVLTMGVFVCVSASRGGCRETNMK